MYYAKKSLPIDSINIFSYFLLLNIFDDPNKKLAIPESSGWIFRDVAGASLSPLVGTGRRVATAGLVVPAPARRHSPPCSNQWGERCARDVTENPSGGLLRRADIRRISAGYPPDIRRVSAGYPPDIRPPENGFWGPEEYSGWIFRDVRMEPVLVSLFKGDNAKIRQFYSNDFNLKQPC